MNILVLGRNLRDCGGRSLSGYLVFWVNTLTLAEKCIGTKYIESERYLSSEEQLDLH